MKGKRKIGAIAAAAALVGGLAIIPNAGANLTGSSFEGNDGNIVASAGGVDWANLAASGGTLSVGTDQPTGQNDNSFTQGSKEDDVDVVIGLGSIPNNKADIGKFAVGSLVPASGPLAGNTLMTLAWVRNNDGGTTNFDFEINQLAQPDLTLPAGAPTKAVHLNRKGDGAGPLSDDILINYDLQGGASNPTLTFQKWQGNAWGQVTTISGADSEGKINCVTSAACPSGAGAITQANSGPFNQAIAATRFGEADIDLTALGLIPNQNDPNRSCVSFSSAWVKSRSSSSFSSQMKDYAAPIPLGLNTCGEIVIKKVTQPSPDPTNTSFPFTLTGESNFSLKNGEQFSTGDDLNPGTYSAAELTPAGWTLTDATCDDGSNPAAINVGPNEKVTCTFTNTGLATIIIKKVTQPDPDPTGQAFPFSLNGPGVSKTFNLTNGQQEVSSGLSPTSGYVASETIPAEWTNLTASCDDGSPVNNISLSPGEVVTCIFTNQHLAKLHIKKIAERPGVDFDFVTSGGLTPSSFALADGGVQDYVDLAPGLYGVDEVIPAGWNLASATCDNGDAATAVTLIAGSNVTCTFTNVIERGAVVVHKDRKHAADGPGLHPHAGVTFNVETAGDFVTDANGNICVPNLPVSVLDGTYTVTESLPAGYHNPTLTKEATVVEGGCADATPVTFVNTPLTNIALSVDSQVDGGTASSIDCGAGPVSTDANGDGSTARLDLEPGSYTCTVVIDP